MLFILAFVGGILLLKKHQYKQAFIPLMIVIGGSFSLALAIYGETRYKTLFMPFIFMMSAITLLSLLNKKLQE